VTRSGRRNQEAEGHTYTRAAPSYGTTKLKTALCGEEAMKATQKLHELGQSLWLDNITRDLLTDGF
jgi:hypothetical protein